MKSPDIPANEAQRLTSLRESGILTAGEPARFDRLTRLARHLFNVPVAIVSLVDAESLVFKSCNGLHYVTQPRRVSFCGHVILSDKPLIVPDAKQDSRFSDNPLVLGEPHIRFYAGHPLRLPDGAMVGSFCLLDHNTRTFGPQEQALLQDLAAIVEGEFATISEATTDSLTGLLNRRGFEHLANFAIASAQRRAEPLTLGWLDLDKFKQINDSFGHAEGDCALREMTHLLNRAFRDTDLLVRHGGDEFGILFSNTDENGAWIAMQHLVEEANAFNLTSGKPWKLSFSWGVIEFNHEDFHDLSGWLGAADKRMYAMKMQHDADGRMNK
ncbi:sensor domain-containing diguanylate cyclase [Enterobacter sp. CC120223-11]|uniref:sensor domain-containing diguanylate cyclase n=1 Tax=Enterobacter sp. CC120223-11 TaxID=1378073 RepID=UPI000BDA9DCA|nr:sensor domain-containing diguanylate cyclase [Enterobacter sp. CC120223-11]SNY69914.1 diguanylate cyclase with GAF sensor [Enterobacter sp. CC120223-11]